MGYVQTSDVSQVQATDMEGLRRSCRTGPRRCPQVRAMPVQCEDRPRCLEAHHREEGDRVGRRRRREAPLVPEVTVQEVGVELALASMASMYSQNAS